MPRLARFAQGENQPPPIPAHSGGATSLAHPWASGAAAWLSRSALGVAPAAAGYGRVRVARLRSFPLPGGDRAVIEPRRVAIGILYEVFGEAGLNDHSLAAVRSFSESEREVLKRMLIRGINTPRTTSIGRLFDGVASLVGLVQQTSFEGQAATARRRAPVPEPG